MLITQHEQHKQKLRAADQCYGQCQVGRCGQYNFRVFVDCTLMLCSFSTMLNYAVICRKLLPLSCINTTLFIKVMFIFLASSSVNTMLASSCRCQSSGSQFG